MNFACLMPGHYEAGVKDIKVAASDGLKRPPRPARHGRASP